MELVPLHTRPDCCEETVELLNSEWPRSKAARHDRLYSLEKSCDDLPCSLILLDDGKVIGHSRLVAAQGVKNSCLLESVVVPTNLRGKGIGRILMEKTEKHARSMGYKKMFLNTIDKQEFYRHIGYQLSHPVVSLGANSHLVPESLISKMIDMTVTQGQQSLSSDDKTSKQTKSGSDRSPDSPTPPPPPPPPAPPSSPCASLDDRHVTRLSRNSVTWMKKDLI